MACLGQCNDCNCHILNVCDDTDKIKKSMDSYISDLKDAECEIRHTPCNKLTDAVATFSNKVWCINSNIGRLVLNNRTRIDKICETQKCEIEALKKLTEFLKAQMQGNVDFSINSKAESDDVGKTTMKSSTSPDGTFKFNFDTNDGIKIIGNGEINGKVEHEYSTNEDGSIKVKVKSITINNVKWDKTADNAAANKNISLHIKDINGNALYDKNYDGSTSWSEDVNKTVELNVDKDVSPMSTTGDIDVLTIDDNWIINTHGRASIKYDNNNKGAIPPDVTCEAKCDACSDKENTDDSDTSSDDTTVPIAPPTEVPVEKTKKVVSESPNLVVTETDDAYKLTLNETEKVDHDTIYDDTELRKKVDSLENKTIKYKYVEKSICITPFTPTKNGDTYIFNLTEAVDKNKDEVIISLKTTNLLIPSYDKSNSYIVSKNMTSLINLPLNSNTDKYINTSIMLYNGDIIHLSFKYRIDGDKLYISELNSLIDVGKVLGDSKTIKYNFLLDAGKLNYTIKDNEYFIRTDHYNAIDIFKKSLEITQGE